jgi:hypothetical protein
MPGTAAGSVVASGLAFGRGRPGVRDAPGADVALGASSRCRAGVRDARGADVALGASPPSRAGVRDARGAYVALGASPRCRAGVRDARGADVALGASSPCRAGVRDAPRAKRLAAGPGRDAGTPAPDSLIDAVDQADTSTPAARQRIVDPARAHPERAPDAASRRSVQPSPREFVRTSMGRVRDRPYLGSITSGEPSRRRRRTTRRRFDRQATAAEPRTRPGPSILPVPASPRQNVAARHAPRARR